MLLLMLLIIVSIYFSFKSIEKGSDGIDYFIAICISLVGSLILMLIISPIMMSLLPTKHYILKQQPLEKINNKYIVHSTEEILNDKNLTIKTNKGYKILDTDSKVIYGNQAEYIRKIKDLKNPFFRKLFMNLHSEESIIKIPNKKQ